MAAGSDADGNEERDRQRSATPDWNEDEPEQEVRDDEATIAEERVENQSPRRCSRKRSRSITPSFLREDLESSESVRELDALLRRTDKQAKAKPRRQKTEKETELAHALLGTVQLRGRAHREVT